MFHVNGKSTSLHAIRRVRLERPEAAGSYWEGIPHGELIDAVRVEIARRDWEVLDEKFVLGDGGAALAAAFDLKTDIPVPPGQTLSLGLSTSNDRHKALKVVVGTVVGACCNGMVSGEVAFRRKHTINLNIQTEVESMLDAFTAHAVRVEDHVRAMQSAKISDREVEHILFKACRENSPTRVYVLPWGQIGDVYQEWAVPRFPEFAARTVWSLYNAFTWVAKGWPPLQQMDRIARFQKLLPVKAPKARGAKV